MRFNDLWKSTDCGEINIRRKYNFYLLFAAYSVVSTTVGHFLNQTLCSVLTSNVCKHLLRN